MWQNRFKIRVLPALGESSGNQGVNAVAEQSQRFGFGLFGEIVGAQGVVQGDFQVFCCVEESSVQIKYYHSCPFFLYVLAIECL